MLRIVAALRGNHSLCGDELWNAFQALQIQDVEFDAAWHGPFFLKLLKSALADEHNRALAWYVIVG